MGIDRKGYKMKITLVYDTVYGNTKQIAKAIKAGISNTHEIKLIEAERASIDDVKDADMLILGSPTHGGWFTDPVKMFLQSIQENSLGNRKGAAFDTTTSKENESWFVKKIIDFFGYASKRISKELVRKGLTLISSESFYVHGKEGPLQEGEIERAKEWSAKLTG